jgi:XapX domain-containing protein
MAMTGYLNSLLLGLAASVAFGIVQVRSPAPPLIALIGLLGMVLGEQAVDITKRHLAPPAHTSIQQPPADVQVSPDETNSGCLQGGEFGGDQGARLRANSGVKCGCSRCNRDFGKHLARSDALLQNSKEEEFY